MNEIIYDFSKGVFEEYPLISVVVPVYKVENFLDKCVSSIVTQEYSNLEIILVDDGSPDRCGDMCDEWAKKDERIKVVHQANGGLSDARNTGLTVAKGDYIAFVDSDDYIDPQMYRILVLAMQRTKSDIVNCYAIEENFDRPKQAYNDNKIYLFTSEEAIDDLFVDNKYLRHAAWNKLYKRSLFDEIKYPKGRLFEDAAITYKLFDSVNTVATVDAALYHYVQRSGSITNAIYKKESVIHRLENAVAAYKYFTDKEKLQIAAFIWNERYVFDLWTYAYENQDYETAKKIYVNFKKLVNTRNFSKLNIKQQIKILLFIFSPKVLYKLKQIWRRYNLWGKYEYSKRNFKEILNSIRNYKIRIKEVEKLPLNTVILWGVPLYGNLGDQAITYAEVQFVKSVLPNSNIWIITEATCAEYIAPMKIYARKKHFVFVLPGGGNMGALYKYQEERRQMLVKHIKNSKIISFPQSVDYSEGTISYKKAKNIYERNKKLELYARDKKNYEKMKKLFPRSTVSLAPDIVAYLNKCDNIKQEKSRDVLFCIRSDKEANAHSKEVLERVKSMLRTKDIEWIDTYGSQYVTAYENQGSQLENFWSEIKKSRMIVTDRLHGMIFSMITDTPCIVLDNSTGKISAFYNSWLKNISGILLYEGNFSYVESFIKNVFESNETLCSYKDLSKEFDLLRESLKEHE